MFQLRSLPNQGYTMIEVVTTLVVAGILTTVGIVAVRPAVQHAKVRSAANVVAATFSMPRLWQCGSVVQSPW